MKAYILNKDFQDFKQGTLMAVSENWKHWLKKECIIIDVPEELIGKPIKATLVNGEYILEEIIME